MRFIAMLLLALAVVSTRTYARELRQPALKSQAALVVDQQSGEILLGKNVESKLPIASLTKLMTAIVTLDAELDADEPVTISKADVDRLRGSHSRLKWERRSRATSCCTSPSWLRKTAPPPRSQAPTRVEKTRACWR